MAEKLFPQPLRRHIAIAAGGTAGHVMPALAVADAYRAAVPEIDITFFGTRLGVESESVPAAGYAFEALRSAPFFGVGWLRRIDALRQVLQGAAQARRVLKQKQVALVIGFGGYTSAPALIAARSLAIPALIHESNVDPGLTNRWLARLAQTVLVSFPETKRHFPKQQVEIVGLPVRAAYSSIAANRAAPSSARAARILVVGGSLGSPFLNREVPATLAGLSRNGLAIEVLHQAGDPQRVPFTQHDARFAVPDLEAIRTAYRDTQVAAKVVAYIDDMPAAYAWADIAISSAGTSLAECAAAGLPTLTVPLSAAAEDHQRANAAAFARLTGSYWTSDRDWKRDAVLAQLAAWLSDATAWSEASARMRSAANQDAARRVVALCERVLNRQP